MSAVHSPRERFAPKVRLSVIVPVLDEARRIGRTLEEIDRVAGIDEVVVVDGGSRDDTVAIARSHLGVRVRLARRGRARQMNLGARVARGDVLLFLHADCTLPRDAVEHVRAALAEPHVVAGAFRIRTVLDDRRHWVRPLLGLADRRSRRTRLPYGDQALFVRRSAFFAVGGFPEVPIFEDIELARRLWRIGRIVTVPACVEVSGRRFAHRPVRAAIEMRLLPWLHAAGVAPSLLASLYGEVR